MNTTPTQNATVLELRSDGRNPNSVRIQKWMPALPIAYVATFWGCMMWALGFWGHKSSDIPLPFILIGVALAFNWALNQMQATLTITDTHISARCPLMPQWLRWFHTHHWEIAFSDVESIAYFSRKPSPHTYATWTSQQLQLTLRNGKKKIISPAMWFIPESPAKRLLLTGLETLPLITALRNRGLHVPPLDSVAGPPDINNLTPAVKWFLGASVAAVLFGMLGNFVWHSLWVGLPLWWIYAGCCLAGCAIFGVFAACEKPRPVWPHNFFAGFFWCIAMLFVVPVLHRPF